MCVCVREREIEMEGGREGGGEREREREREGGRKWEEREGALWCVARVMKKVSFVFD